jgi:hypothetical protein
MLAFSDYLEEKAKKTSIKINPTKDELKEFFDFDEFDSLSDEELEIVMEELLHEMMVDEGFELDEVLEFFGSDDLLTEATEGRWERVKSAAKKAGRAIARGAGYAAGVAKRAVKAAGDEMKKGYERGSKGSSSDSSSSSSSSSGSSAPAEPEKDRSAAKARLNRMRMAKVKRGIKKVVGKTARYAQKGASLAAKGADKVAKRLGEENVQYIGGDLTDGGLEVRTWSLEEVHPELFEGYAPGDVDQKVGAVTAIPKDEREAAKARLLAKAKAKRKEKGLEEGMSLKDFKANRRKLKRREASADAKKRGHVGKEWYNSGRTYSPDEAKRMRSKLDDEERSTRHRSSIDPEGDDSNYSADKTKNPKKIRKQKAMGEETILERGDFWHPDPKQDRKLGGPGANQRAREDRKSEPKKDYSKTTKPGESYMDFHKRKQAEKKSAYKSSGSTAYERLKKAGATGSAMQTKKKEGIRDKIKRKLGLKNSYEPEGQMVDEARRGPAAPGKSERAEKAKASLAALNKRKEVLAKHEKKTGTKLDVSKSPEAKSHAKNFPGSRQEKKVKGSKETPSETQRRRTNRQVDRVVKHGYTSKEKKDNAAMAKHTSRFD